jgi:hypothetical protein
LPSKVAFNSVPGRERGSSFPRQSQHIAELKARLKKAKRLREWRKAKAQAAAILAKPVAFRWTEGSSTPLLDGAPAHIGSRDHLISLSNAHPIKPLIATMYAMIPSSNQCPWI